MDISKFFLIFTVSNLKNKIMISREEKLDLFVQQIERFGFDPELMDKSNFNGMLISIENTSDEMGYLGTPDLLLLISAATKNGFDFCIVATVGSRTIIGLIEN